MTQQRRALFLDLDGLINIDHDYVCSPDECEFVDGIFGLCQRAIEINTPEAGARGEFCSCF